MMYNPQQLTEQAAKNALQPPTGALTPEKVRQARTRLQDALTNVTATQDAIGQVHLTHGHLPPSRRLEARNAAHDAHKDALIEADEAQRDFDDIMRRGGKGIEERERWETKQAALQKSEAEQHEAQQHLKEAEFRKHALATYTAAGGTVEKFEEAFPGMWSQHLRSETMHAMKANKQDDAMSKLAKTGNYPL